MEWLNDDFNWIAEIFKKAITKQLKKIEACAKSQNDKVLLAQVNEVLEAGDIISKISCLNESGSIFNPKMGNDQTKRDYFVYKVQATANARIISDLISTFDEFKNVFNRDEKCKISIKTAMYFIESMETVIDIAKQEENHKFGISFLNAAVSYQYIAEPNTSPDDIIGLADYTKRKWRHNLKLKPLGKGKHGADLYDLAEMADFVRYIGKRNIKLTKLLQWFIKYQEEL